MEYLIRFTLSGFCYSFFVYFAALVLPVNCSCPSITSFCKKHALYCTRASLSIINLTRVQVCASLIRSHGPDHGGWSLRLSKDSTCLFSLHASCDGTTRRCSPQSTAEVGTDTHGLFFGQACIFGEREDHGLAAIIPHRRAGAELFGFGKVFGFRHHITLCGVFLCLSLFKGCRCVVHRLSASTT